MGNSKIKAFKKSINSKDIPADLEHWFNNTNNCGQLFADLGFTLLNEQELETLKNPNPLGFKDDATYSAMKEVMKCIVLVAKNEKDQYFGYSLVDDSSIAKAPIVRHFDTAFYLEPGNLIEALIMSISDEKEEVFRKHKETISVSGFQIGHFKELMKEADEVYDNFSDPEDYMDSLLKGRDLTHLAALVSDTEFVEWQSPRFGTENPTRVYSELWKNCVYSKEGAYTVKSKHNEKSYELTWCFSRYGQSITRVDGKEIFIAGEHEDSYDPDFYIYNDVVVVNSDDTVEIYNYPKAVFPPTDFHSATLIDPQTILIIGSLGYMDERKPGFTPVFKLNSENFKIEQVITHGNNPGWIYKHRALLSEDGQSIRLVGGEIQSEANLENIDEWSLNLQTFEWTRLTEKKWKRWRLERAGNKFNSLWNIRQALYSLNASWVEDSDEQIEELRKELNYPIDVTKVEDLYEFNDMPSYKALPERPDEYNFFRISIEGVTIKFHESHYHIEATVEGDLNEKIIETIQDEVLKRVSELENCEYVLRKFY